ncbi:hypothetical protein OYT88_03930 [Sporolactobacillus sp. CQH2019]|uniref:hypothetical protein n=1 Tax=Sporolactobacillus sp. CQH2019 TaxID=3023512 RepID=UPI002368B2FB|nr:hypothetical protein [Sporolactobacillus sp. CQH2019]MDD9147700.1 hypothetical protein [Sporolactobacillus sp. CQH2019]
MADLTVARSSLMVVSILTVGAPGFSVVIQSLSTMRGSLSIILADLTVARSSLTVVSILTVGTPEFSVVIQSLSTMRGSYRSFWPI